MNKYEEKYFTDIIKNSTNYADVCRKLNIGTTKGNRDTVKKYIKLYNLCTKHFIKPKSGGNIKKMDLKVALVINSPYRQTSNLKIRLYKEGLKERECEMCGQGEEWKGKKMSLILDHINGVNDDNRIENLRIVCPNCNATLPTHGGKNKKLNKIKKNKRGDDNLTDAMRNAYIKQRKVDRPTKNVLISDIKENGYSKTGLKYGVTDNAIRKWVKYYGIDPKNIK